MSNTIYHFHLVYKTTNNITGKIYIGLHSTNDINDSYLGSGIHIKNAIKKYGRDSFTKEILFVFKTREEASEKEKELVNEEFINSQNTYNASTGGLGYTGEYRSGKDHHWYGRTLTEEHKEKISISHRGDKNPMYGVRLCGKKNGMYGKGYINRKKVIVNGVLYNSCTEAAITNNIAKSTMSGWIKKGKAKYV